MSRVEHQSSSIKMNGRKFSRQLALLILLGASSLVLTRASSPGSGPAPLSSGSASASSSPVTPLPSSPQSASTSSAPLAAIMQQQASNQTPTLAGQSSQGSPGPSSSVLISQQPTSSKESSSQQRANNNNQQQQSAGPSPSVAALASIASPAGASPTSASSSQPQSAQLPNPSQQQAIKSAPQAAPSSSAAASTFDSHSSSFSPSRSSNQQAQQQMQMPNITIYISSSEVKKLLGIDSEIYYIQQGTFRPYPLAFAIPLGYNQSDIIFTWQNLGAANVNYSISLSIGNRDAVETPLINITRSGLMPRQEQVFKITLPCSGKLSAEVDVQVLIQLSCLQESLSGPSAGQNGAFGSMSSDLDASNGLLNLIGNENGQHQVRTFNHTLAVRRKKICTQHAPAMSTRKQQQQQIPASPAPSLHFNEPQPASKQRAAAPFPAPINHLGQIGNRPQPFDQMDSNQMNQARFFPKPAQNFYNTDQQSDQQQHHHHQHHAADLNLNQQVANQRDESISAALAHVPQPGSLHLQANINTNNNAGINRDQSSILTRINDQSMARPQQKQQKQDQHFSTPAQSPNNPGSIDFNQPPANLVKDLPHPMPPVPPIPIDNPLNKWVKPPAQPNSADLLSQQFGQAQSSAQLNSSSNPLIMIAIGVSMFVVIGLILILLAGFAGSNPSSSGAVGIASGFSRDSSLKKYPINSFGKLSSIKSWLTRRSHSAASSSRSSSTTSTGRHQHHHNQAGLGSFGATFGIISSGGTLRGGNAHNHNHHHHHHLQQHSMRLNKSSNSANNNNNGVLIGAEAGAGFNFGHSTNKLSNENGHSTTLIRGLNQAGNGYQSSGKQQQTDNNNQTSFHCSYYGTNSIYSHPPTADLLGTGYQASSGGSYQPQLTNPTSFHQPGNMYHPLTTTGNNGQTTRLVWQQANEQQPQQQQQQQLNSNEAGYFMPLSETGSLYQTIE